MAKIEFYKDLEDHVCIKHKNEYFYVGDSVELENRRGHTKKCYISKLGPYELSVQFATPEHLRLRKERSYTYNELASIKHIEIKSEDDDD